MKGRTIISGKFLTFLLLGAVASLTTACFTIVADDTRQPEENDDLVSSEPGGAISSSSGAQPPGQDNDNTYELYLIAYPEEGADFLVDPEPDSQGAYSPGTTVTVDVVPRPGWEIERWVGSVYSISGGVAKIDMEQDQTVLVRLVQVDQTPTPISSALTQTDAAQPVPAFALTINGIRVAGRFIELDNGSVEVSPDPQLPRNLYQRGTRVKIIATAATGYQLAGWSGDCATDTKACEIALNRDKNVAVAFKPLEELFGLTVVLLPEDGGDVEVSPQPNGPRGLYLAGTTVELEVKADKGFRFAEWEGDCSKEDDEDDNGGKRERCQVTMNEGKRVVASFSRKE